MTNQPLLQSIVQKLVSFRTVTGERKEVEKAYRYIQSLYRGLPVQVKKFTRNGFTSQILFFKSSGWRKPKVLLNAHIDVVPSQAKGVFQPKVSQGKLYARGASDMKGPLAAFLVAMREAVSLPSLPSVALLITSEEETGGENGAEYAVEALHMRPQFVINGDGAHNPWVVLTKARGVLWVELVARGKSAHGARPWLGENAVEKAMKAIERIQAFIGPGKPSIWKTSVNLSWIEAPNRTANMVPDMARAVLDIRFTDDLAKTPEELLARLQKIVPQVKLSIVKKAPLVLTDEKNRFVQDFSKTVKRVTNQKVVYGFDEGATDARFFAEKNIPAVVIGAGGGDRHGDKEWVSLKNVHLVKDIVMQFLKDL